MAGAGVAERVGTFVELAGSELGREPALVIHHGYTLAFGPDAQADVHGGIGLTEAAPAWFAGVGIAFRR